MKKNPAAAFIAMGFELVGVILASLFIGQWLDNNYGWAPWGTLGLLILGFGGWISHMILLLSRMDR